MKDQIELTVSSVFLSMSFIAKLACLMAACLRGDGIFRSYCLKVYEDDYTSLLCVNEFIGSRYFVHCCLWILTWMYQFSDWTVSRMPFAVYAIRSNYRDRYSY